MTAAGPTPRQSRQPHPTRRSGEGRRAAALTLMAKQRGDVSLVQQVLFHPVTDTAFDTGSHHQFAEGYFLRCDSMQWFWDQYTTDQTGRAQITASPLCATTEQPTGLPAHAPAALKEPGR
ncbi:alpha/beta hydrolase fold domain-containing protein [Nonomuraea sp. NPDC050783]|uniref:alpha/beta hydrolase fold domain-containing protein n=1 Tax=Nonomuraea sp. NPDC050783 TaxID=3154634 RepID=UPI0034652595